jgi:hypothetical protein
MTFRLPHGGPVGLDPAMQDVIVLDIAWPPARPILRGYRHGGFDRHKEMDMAGRLNALFQSLFQALERVTTKVQTLRESADVAPLRAVSRGCV